MLNPQTINQVISPVAFRVGEITVDAEFVASGLGLSSEALKRLMRSGLVVAQFELGVGDDRGRYRLVFRYRHRTWWIIVAGDGAVVESFPPLSEVRISPDSITVKPRGKTHKRSASSPNVGGPKEAVQ